MVDTHLVLELYFQDLPSLSQQTLVEISQTNLYLSQLLRWPQEGRKPMTCFGYSWIFLDILGYFWIFLDILGYSWIFCVRARFCARDFVRARFCARATMGERPAKNQKIAKKYIYRYPIKFFFYKKLRLDASKRMRTILNPSETDRCPKKPKN